MPTDTPGEGIDAAKLAERIKVLERALALTDYAHKLTAAQLAAAEKRAGELEAERRGVESRTCDGLRVPR